MSQTRSQDAWSVRLNVDSLESRVVPSVTIRFDYSLDPSGQFQQPELQAALERSATLLTSQLQDHLAPIIPSNGNSWQASFFNPASGNNVTIPNLAIAADEIVIYIASAPLGGGQLGLTTTGGYSAAGTQNWLDVVKGRGQPGALGNAKSDFSTWGGMITFDSSVSWSEDPKTQQQYEYDLESVALHEILHIFGFGLDEPAFTRNISNGQFAGPNVVAVAGSPIPLDEHGDHWRQDTHLDADYSPLSPALPQGQHRGLTRLDMAALADIGWEVAGINVNRPAQTVQSPVAALAPLHDVPHSHYIIEPAPASQPIITSPNTAGPSEAVFSAATTQGIISYDMGGRAVSQYYNAGTATSPQSVLTIDLNGDSVPDLVTGTGAGDVNRVTVTDGLTGATLSTFQPFEANFMGGVNLSAGDLTGDGTPDIVVSPDDSGGPIVAIYDGQALAQGRVQELQRFFGIQDPNFRGGARTSVGDVNGDHVPDLVVAAGIGGGPRVSIYDGNTIPSQHVGKLISDFFAFEQELRNGANVTVEDINDDGFAEVIVGSGAGGAPRVIAYNGADLLRNHQMQVLNFYAGDLSSRAGVKVAMMDVDHDSRPDLVTTVPDSTGTVDVYTAPSLGSAYPSPTMILQPMGTGIDGIEIG